MLPFYSEKFANAASAHRFGWEAAVQLELAREKISSMIGMKNPHRDFLSVIFTSGATESNNLALLGYAAALGRTGHFVSQKTEHASVLEVLCHLEAQGHKITLLPVDRSGYVDPDDLRHALKKKTDLVSIMHANNETGVVQDISLLSKITHEHGAFFHTDATQSLGKIDFDVETANVDLASFSCHKLGGTKGIGGLYVAHRRPKIRLRPVIFGGGHEGGLRSGTSNVAGVMGMLETLESAAKNRMAYAKMHTAWLENFRASTMTAIPGFFANTPASGCLPNTINIGFAGLKAEDLIRDMPRFCFATGSACAQKNLKPSHVLMAMGRTEAEASASIRISLGWNSTEEDVLKFTQELVECVKNKTGEIF